jgi:hypothetical protein
VPKIERFQGGFRSGRRDGEAGDELEAGPAGAEPGSGEIEMGPFPAQDVRVVAEVGDDPEAPDAIERAGEGVRRRRQRRRRSSITSTPP